MNFDLVVIGSGPGGYVAAIRAAQLGLKVACIDKRKEPGGTCLNVGCIPSKTLLHASELFAKFKTPDFAKMMQQKSQVTKGFNDGILALFKKNSITYLTGSAKLTSPHTVQVAGDPIEAKHILLATGSEPIALPFLPFDEKRVISSTGALSLTTIPKKLCIIGAGVIGVELGSVYSRLGSAVTFIEFLDRICPAFDESLSKELHALLSKQNMTFHLSTKVTGAELSSSGVLLRTSDKTFDADCVLVAIGRKPYTQNLGLETVGITPDSKGFIPINGRFQTTVPHIFAIGDIVDGPMLAHKASEEGVAVAELISGHNPTVEYISIPNVIYTSPEVASVGLTEQEAKAHGLAYKTGLFPFKANSRARCNGEDDGFVKILADGPTDRLLGVHIIGAAASELIATATFALHTKATALDLAHTPFAHPTLSEALKEAALALHKRAIHR